MKVLLLFGAGASHSIIGVHPDRLPLGNNLFDRLIADGAPTAAKIKPEIQTAFRTNFESGMLKLSTEQNVLVGPFQIDLARFFLKHHATSPSHYHRLLTKFAKTKVRPIFSTLNYDLLLDDATERFGGYHVIVVAEPKGLILLKLHGSCNFFPNLGNNVFNITSQRVPGGTGATIEAPPSFLTREEAQQYLKVHTGVPPIMSNFVVGKEFISCPATIAKIQQSWREAVSTADRIVIAGVAYNKADDHIWGPLAASKARFAVVDPFPENICDWSKAEGRTIEVLGQDFGKSLDAIVEFSGRC